MARLRGASAYDTHEAEGTSRNSTGPSNRHSRQQPRPSSLDPSSSSDKENDQRLKDHPRRETNRSRSRTTEGSGGLSTMSEARKRKAPRELAATDQQTQGSTAQNPRRGQNAQPNESTAVRDRKLANLKNKDFYDPDQDPAERRRVRGEMRNLSKELNDNRSEYLKPESKGLQTIIEKSNAIFKDVKQTSDATIDSRTLIQAADLTLKRTTELTLGDASSGIDVDDFVAKCIRFMRQGEDEQMGTQTQRRRRDMDEDGDGIDGDCNWPYLGRKACFPFNSRPCVPGFLLGPLSVQKRVRQHTQRRAREARATAADATRPKALDQKDMDKAETVNLTVICEQIYNHLKYILEEGERKCNEVFDNKTEELTEAEAEELMMSYGISDDGGMPLVHFCFNPRSFGQTVENLFYVSFLIREGKIGLNYDSKNLPTLSIAPPGEVAQSKTSTKHHGIFALDYDVWDDIIKSHGVTHSLIPHRDEEAYEDGVVDGTGFYE